LRYIWSVGKADETQSEGTRTLPPAPTPRPVTSPIAHLANGKANGAAKPAGKRPLPPTIDPKTAALRAKREAAARKAKAAPPAAAPKPEPAAAPKPTPKTAAKSATKAASAKPTPAAAPAKPATKPAAVSDKRIAELLADLVKPRDVLAQARLYKAVLAETGWPAVEIARRLPHSNRAELGRRWDDVINHVSLLALEAKYQTAAANGQLSVGSAWDLLRVPAVHRPALFAAIQEGKNRKAVRALGKQLMAGG
jgi:hypothetical protein